jgi:hypothetical protein
MLHTSGRRSDVAPPSHTMSTVMPNRTSDAAATRDFAAARLAEGLAHDQVCPTN